MASILEEINLNNRLIIIGPSISSIGMIRKGATKGRSKDMSHDFESQNEVKVLIWDADSRTL